MATNSYSKTTISDVTTDWTDWEFQLISVTLIVTISDKKLYFFTGATIETQFCIFNTRVCLFFAYILKQLKQKPKVTCCFIFIILKFYLYAFVKSGAWKFFNLKKNKIYVN